MFWGYDAGLARTLRVVHHLPADLTRLRRLHQDQKQNQEETKPFSKRRAHTLTA